MGPHKYAETKSPCKGVFVYLEQNTSNISLKNHQKLTSFAHEEGSK